jgi:hypothetical protein
VAAAIVALGEASYGAAGGGSQPAGLVTSYHLTNPRSSTYAQLGQYIADAVASLALPPPPPAGDNPVTIRGASYDQWRAALLRSIRQRKEGTWCAHQ